MSENFTKADNWDAHWQDLSNDFYFNTPAVRYRWQCIDQLLNLSHTSLTSVKLLDIGCGTGKLIEYFLHRYNICAKGTDNSLTGLDIAKKINQQAIFFKADLCAEFKDETTSHFGWATHATCSEVLEHLDDPIHFLKNASQFLQQGATLVVSVPGGPKSSFDHRVGHRKHYTPKMLTHELKQAGYTVEKTFAAGFPFHNIYRLAFILRGESVFNDAKNQLNNKKPLMTFVMNCFHFLFKFNLNNSPLGWTVLAKAKWQG